MTAIDQTSDAFVLYSDAHKDAYGFRASPMNFETQEDLEADFSRMCDQIAENIEVEKCAADLSWNKFTGRIETMVKEGTAPNTATAVRWMVEAEDVHGDIGFFCYLNGLAYGKEAEVERMMKG